MVFLSTKDRVSDQSPDPVRRIRPKISNANAVILQIDRQIGNEVSQQQAVLGFVIDELTPRVSRGCQHLVVASGEAGSGGKYGGIAMGTSGWQEFVGKEICSFALDAMTWMPTLCMVNGGAVLGGGRDQQSFVSLGPSQGRFRGGDGREHDGAAHFAQPSMTILLLKSARPLCNGSAAVELPLHATRPTCRPNLHPRCTCTCTPLNCVFPRVCAPAPAPAASVDVNSTTRS